MNQLSTLFEYCQGNLPVFVLSFIHMYELKNLSSLDYSDLIHIIYSETYRL
jgi:hypothetical protein